MLSKAIARFWAFDLSPPVCAGPAKIVKGESKDKRENLFFFFVYDEPHPIFYKDKESLAYFALSSCGRWDGRVERVNVF